MTSADISKLEIESLISNVDKLCLQQYSLTEFQRTVYAYTKMIPRG
jgi:hypothetical protein